MNDSIKLYSSPTCPKCRALKMQLQAKHIEFEEIHDVDALIALNIKNLPVLQVNEEFFTMPQAMAWLKEK